MPQASMSIAFGEKKPAAHSASEQSEKNDMANCHGDHGPAQDRGP